MGISNWENHLLSIVYTDIFQRSERVKHAGLFAGELMREIAGWRFNYLLITVSRAVFRLRSRQIDPFTGKGKGSVRLSLNRGHFRLVNQPMLPRKHKAFTQWCFNIWSASQTVVQHQTNIGTMYVVRLEILTRKLDTLTHCRFNVGPTSQIVVQH